MRYINRSTLNHPLLYVVLFFAIGFLYFPLSRLLHLPEINQIIDYAQLHLTQYGYLIIFIAAILEATPLFNSYVPGSVIIVLTVASSRQNGLNPFLLVGLVDLGFFIGYILDWSAGHYGWYKLFHFLGWGPALRQVESQLKQSGKRWLWLTYFNPDIASLSTTAAGILGYKLPDLLAYVFWPVIGWNIMWGLLAYYLGDQLLRSAGPNSLLICLVISLIFYVVAVFRQSKGPSVLLHQRAG